MSTRSDARSPGPPTPPQAPPDGSDSALSDEQLDAVSGGTRRDLTTRTKDLDDRGQSQQSAIQQ